MVDLIRGKHVNDALQILRATPNRGAHLVDRVLQSAMANADQSLEADMENLRVQKAWVDGGPIRRKVRPAPRLRRSIIRSQSSHINIVLDDGQ